jgi:hypothetical protein
VKSVSEVLSGSFTPGERSGFLHQFKGLREIARPTGDQRSGELRRIF